MVSGFMRTYPTLVGERLVVKLFGYFPGWRRSAEAEIAANRAIEDNHGIYTPKIVASGSLFPGDEDDWPFLIMGRLGGQPWRQARPGAETAGSIASQLGGQIRRLHESGLPSGLRIRVDWIAAHGSEAAERHRKWGSLPDHLVDEIAIYLANYRPERRCLVHGDITEDHIFVAEDELVGVIDWGDAMVTDPFYELGALHLGAFAGDRRLGSFLLGYGWPLDEGFADHALQVVLMHEFDLFGSVADRAQGASSLTTLAKEVWTPTA